VGWDDVEVSGDAQYICRVCGAVFMCTNLVGKREYVLVTWFIAVGPPVGCCCVPVEIHPRDVPFPERHVGG
jgi:hypothetical protein